MLLYASLYPRAAERIRAEARAAGWIHGSRARDALIECGCPTADSYATEKLLEELCVPLIAQGPQPTVSQKAFIGLQFRKHPGFVAGAKEHYYWRLKPEDGAGR